MVQNETLIYAMLDVQSDTTFISEEVCNHLCITGPDVKLILLTMSEVLLTKKILDLYVPHTVWSPENKATISIY